MNNKTNKKMIDLIWIVSVITIIIISAYGTIQTYYYNESNKIIIGEVLVNVEIPAKNFAKPITYFNTALVLFTYTSFKKYDNQIRNISHNSLFIIKIILIIIAFNSLYETMYNFFIWNALQISEFSELNYNVDMLYIQFPDTKFPWNMVFATKFFYGLFISSTYSLFAMHKIENKE